jgi:hypothetical protein
MTQQDQQTLPSQDERANFRYPDTADFPQGPAIGESLPEFTLPDQHGNPVNFSEIRGDGGALVMFHRSARW